MHENVLVHPFLIIVFRKHDVFVQQIMTESSQSYQLILLIISQILSATFS